MRRFLAISIIASMGVVAESAVPAPSFDRVDDAIQLVIAGTGPVTESTKRKFWQLLNVTSDADKRRVKDIVNQLVTPALRLQKSTYRCTLEAWETRRIPICEEALDQFKLMIVRAQRERFDVGRILEARENAKRFWAAGSMRSSVTDVQGNVIPLSRELIVQTLAQLEQRFARLEEVVK
jgi:CRISPR/Cas system-associated endoribonuclease Cas2